MTKKDFIILFAEKLQIKNNDLSPETRLDALNEWDSWNKLTLMTLADESFNIPLTSKDIKEFVTINDIILKIGEQHIS
jgi:acyl carrier protein